MIQKTYFKTKEYCKVKFSFQADNAGTVEILGLNGDWENGVTMKKKKDGSFSGEVSLPKNSTHEFKYRTDANEWLNEPLADGEVGNVYGGRNSLLIVEQ